ncbi:CRISPR-associated helicase/endonuclease Cas3 [Actinocorallia lasiicapitis]
MKELRAKSPDVPGILGELLTDHLRNTLDALILIGQRIGHIPGTPENFWSWAAAACLLHDAGKLPDGFQRMIGNTQDKAVIWGERHEVLSLGFVPPLLADLPPEDRVLIATLVAGHHRSFTQRLGDRPNKLPLANQYGHDRPEDFARKFTPADQNHLDDLTRWLHMTGRSFDLPFVSDVPSLTVADLTELAHRTFEEVLDRWDRALPSKDSSGRTVTLLLGAVTMADHLSSAHASLETRHPLSLNYPADLTARLQQKGYGLRPQQGEAAEISGNMLLRSWTGSGKTEAALLWALRQISEISQTAGTGPRVFYLLPYLASINAMTDRLGNDLRSPDGIGVAHSKAASYHLGRSLAEGCPSDDEADAAAKAISRAEATRNFRELLRVGTPYQLLRGVLAGPVHSSILTDSANSVFILDELHAYDVRRLGMILAMMRLWHEIGGRVAVLSATLPTALAELVSAALNDQVTLVEPPPGTRAPVRHRLHLREAHLTDESSLEEIRGRLLDGESVLVVANNVRDSITLFEALQPFCVELHGEDSAHLLHSRYRRMDRSAAETAILNRFEAGGPRRPGLLVGTQALEVSLNLDLDACHTSAAELEALIQRFGRVNRLAALDPAAVVVHQPSYAPRSSGSADELWADGVYEAEPTRLGWDILCRHDGQTIDEQTVTDWLDEIYDDPSWGAQWKQQIAHHQRAFTEAFLGFALPFEDRSRLVELFDEQFDGTEAILLTDRQNYADALLGASDRRAGRLQADDFLLPLPSWARGLGFYDKNLKVRIIDAEYDPRLGLTAIHRDPRNIYQPGEIL